MRKTLLALTAAATVAFGTIANPTPSRAMAPGLAALLIVGAVVATVVVVEAVAAAPAPRGTVYVHAKKKKRKM